MKFSVDKQEKYTVFSIEEDKLDTLKAPALKTEFITLFQTGTINLVLDLGLVKYVDSSGLSAILVANRLAKEVNGSFILGAVNDHVLKLMKISKLDTVLEILPTIEEAIDASFLNDIERQIKDGDNGE